ncbi:PAS domain S-box protein [Cronbergia sp. UHCC 0137]|uniref:PAS domain S-box protein n=1 Tax=Cronbergia sp. UHCC 0137 TaxID=3110239 RepID=UPI002B207564|nr:PAS domain S-box protein [Cronbergia sp. UHCC 0137]MEA5620314.1 PAS domain S-box protein [Cronbergia sp. UHCC 0137]
MILEDSPEERSLYCHYLSQDKLATYNVIEVVSGLEALTQLSQTSPDLILLDYQLADINIWEFLNQLRLQFSSLQIPVIMLAEQTDEAIAVQAMKAGVYDYIVKSKLTSTGLCRAVHSVLEKTHLIKQIRMQEQQQQLLAGISLRIRQFLHLEEILETAVQEIREFLKADRVIVYQFDPQMSGKIVAESVLPQWKNLLNIQIEDTCFRENQGIADGNDKIRAICDIYHSELTDCHIQLLEQFQVKANLIVPILLKKETESRKRNLTSSELPTSKSSSQVLWGLLIVHQCSTTRQWETNELDLLQQLSVQLSIAIQQAELYKNLQTLNASLQQKVEERTRELIASEHKFRAIFDNTFQFTGLLTTEGILVEANQTALNFGGIKLEDVVNRPFWEADWWKISQANQDRLRQAIARAAQNEFIRYEVDVLGAGGEIATIDFSLRPLKDETGQVVMLISEGRNISERKKAEQAFQESQILLQLVIDSLPIAIFWKDRNSRYLGCNRQLLLDAGLSSPAEIIGKTDFDMVWRQQAALYQEGDRIVMDLGQPKFNIEEPFTKCGGIHRWLRTNKVPLHNPNGEIIGVLVSYEDITERKQTQQALQESEQRYVTLAASAPVGIYRTDTQGNCLYVNNRWCVNTGLQLQEAAEYGWKRALHPEDRDMVEAQWNHLIQTGQTFSLEYRLVRSDGEETWVFGQAVPEKNPEGTVTGYVGTITDISPRKKSENALRDSEEKFRQFAENSREVMLLRQIDSGELLYVNPVYEEIWGKTTKSLYENPDSWKASMHPDDVERVGATYQATSKEGFFNEEYRIIRPDGGIRWIWGRCFPIRDTAGEIYRIGAIAEDITERKQREEERDRFARQKNHLLEVLAAQNQTLEAQVTQRTAELQQSEKRFRNLVETSSDWIWEINESGIYTYASPQIIHVLGYSPAEVLGKTPFDLMPPEEAERVLKEFMKFVAVQAPFQCLENTNRHQDGRLITLESSGIPIFDEDKQFRGYRGMARDITARKQAETAIHQNEARLQRITANAPGVMYQYLLHPDSSHEFIYVSDRCREMHELEPATILENANAIFNMTHPEDIPSLQESISRSASSLRQWLWEGRIITPSGRLKWIQGVAQPQKQANGDILWDGLILDISSRKQIEIALHNLSDRLDLAIKSAQIGIWDWDIVNDYLIWDDRMYELYGVNASDFKGAYQAWEAGLHPDDILFCRTTIQQAIAGERDFEPEFRVVCPDGTIRFIKAYALVQRDPQGKAQRMIGINFDISERKKSEARLQSAEIKLRNLSDRLKLAVKSAKIGIWDLDLVKDSLLWDDRMYQLFGVSRLNFDPTQDAWAKFEALLYPEDRVNVRETVQKIIIEEKELDTEFRIMLSDGTIRIIKAYGLVQRNSQGQPQRIIGINYDISDRKLAEAEILRSRDLREAIFNESADALFLVDVETLKTIDCNQRAVKMFAANDKTDLIGIEGHQLQKQQFTPEEMQSINDDIENQGFWSREIEYKTFKGELFWGNLAAKQITVAGQKMNLVRVTDISDRKLAEAQLHQTNKQLAASNEQLARATRLKDEFLANMSHELRTPLNAILGLSEGLQEEVFGVVTEKQRRSLQIIERSGTHLLALINDILDLSKIEAGQVELDCTMIDINQLCQSSLSFIKQQAFQKQIQLEVKLQPNLPELMVDERRIRQVLINLLNNAVKFTPEGGSITLTVTREQYPPETEITHLRDFIRIAVIDTGIGIAPENLHKLFQPFVQIDSSLNRQYSGTGLGLSLVKRIVEMHGGQVGVSSQIGVGSRFTADLPCSIPAGCFSKLVNQTSPDLDSPLIETAVQTPLILLAEDNESNILTISSYLEAKGYRLILANNGQEAIALTKSQSPDVILMDIQMPGMDGLEAIKQIRLDQKFVNIPIIALTALAMRGDRERCLAAGANDYLTKPVSLKELATIIKQLLS